jgi:hypothetical protein
MATTKISSRPARRISSSKPFTTTDADVAYRHFLSKAQTIPAESAEVCRANVQIARVNVDRGVAAIAPHIEIVRKKLPDCPIREVLELPALVLGLTVAAGRVMPQASEGEIDARLVKFRPMRELTLQLLEICAELKIVPKAPVVKIRAGKGPLDGAQDGIAIAGMFYDHRAALEGKHPFSPEYLVAMADHANWLVRQLKPTRALALSSEYSPEAIVRDQFWTMVTERHERLREAGVVIFGLKRLDELVPPLQARTQSASTGGDPVDPGASPPSTEP